MVQDAANANTTHKDIYQEFFQTTAKEAQVQRAIKNLIAYQFDKCALSNVPEVEFLSTQISPLLATKDFALKLSSFDYTEHYAGNINSDLRALSAANQVLREGTKEQIEEAQALLKEKFNRLLPQSEAIYAKHLTDWGKQVKTLRGGEAFFLEISTQDLSSDYFSPYLLFNRTCPDCMGSGLSACPNCEGSKKIDCPECEGEQKVPCHICDGRGRIDYPHSIQCPECHGLGKINCPTCQGTGKIKCPDCKGKGVTKCASCKGKGSIVAVWQKRARFSHEAQPTQFACGLEIALDKFHTALKQNNYDLNPVLNLNDGSVEQGFEQIDKLLMTGFTAAGFDVVPNSSGFKLISSPCLLCSVSLRMSGREYTTTGLIVRNEQGLLKLVTFNENYLTGHINYDKEAQEAIKILKELQHTTFSGVAALMHQLDALPSVVRSFFDILCAPDNLSINKLQTASSYVITSQEVRHTLTQEAQKAFEYLSYQAFPDMFRPVLGNMMDFATKACFGRDVLTSRVRRQTYVLGLILLLLINFMSFCTELSLVAIESLGLYWDSPENTLLWSWLGISVLLEPVIMFDVCYITSILLVKSQLQALSQRFQAQADTLLKKYGIKVNKEVLEYAQAKNTIRLYEIRPRWLYIMMGSMLMGHIVRLLVMTILK